MRRHIRFWLLALTIAAVGLGCRTATPPDGPAGAERQALEQRVRALRDEAKQGGTPTPARKAEAQQLAADVRGWQARTGRDDLRVTEESVTTARRADDGGGGGDCEDCIGYLLDGDRICFLERKECPTNEDDDELIIGTICVYTCLWIGSGAEPAMRTRGP